MSFLAIARRSALHARAPLVARRGLLTVSKEIYNTSATASGGGRAGTSKLDDGSMTVNMVPPTELGGAGKGANPEQLLALGYGACFLGALRLQAKEKKISLSDDVKVHTTVTLGNPSDLPGFALRVAIRVGGLDGVTDKAALVQAAHEFCPYSRAFNQGIETSATAE
ncbi:OsmC-like protein [Auriculariales sp. MPI-PUGE-AT-0066]|nr:OsmC-like protein [Auriculariales sp. MPI-PUGE-AT-0066]